jgi:hemoglobin
MASLTDKIEIQELKHIKTLVDTFYAKVRKDEMLQPIFDAVIQDRWPEHLEKMYGFWQTVLLNERAYSGSPFPKHAQLPVEKAHFDRWLNLFEETITEHFIGEKADEAIWRANQMGAMFQAKIAYLRKQSH